MMKDLVVALTLVLVCVGCSDQNPSDVKARDEQSLAKSAYAQLQPNAILVKVGTNVYTKADAEKMIDLRLKMYSIMMSGRGGAGGKKLNRQAVESHVLSMVQTAYRSQVAQLEWAATNGIAATVADIAQFQTNFMTACGVRGETFEKFIGRFSPAERETAEGQIHREAIFSKVNTRYLELNPVQVDDDVLQRYLTSLADYNRAANATNALVWAKGTNVWDKIRKGADFIGVATEHSEEDVFDDNATWGTFRLDELKDNPALVNLLPTLGVGEITPPVEADNGLCIIRLDGMTDMSGATTTRDSMTRYTLSRIYLRLPEVYEVPTREEAIDALNAGLRRRAFSSFVKDLISKDRATFPSGEKVFEEAREMRKMPMMLQQDELPSQIK